MHKRWVTDGASSSYDPDDVRLLESGTFQGSSSSSLTFGLLEWSVSSRPHTDNGRTRQTETGTKHEEMVCRVTEQRDLQRVQYFAGRATSLSCPTESRKGSPACMSQWLTSRKNLELQNRPKWDFWLRFDLACNDQARRHCRTPASNFKSGEAPPPPHQTSASVPDPNLELRELKCTRICKVTISIHFGEQVNRTSRSFRIDCKA